MSYHTPAHLQPLHERLALIQRTLADGRPQHLKHHAARIDGPFLVLRTPDGPLTLRLANLGSAADGAARRANGDPMRRPPRPFMRTGMIIPRPFTPAAPPPAPVRDQDQAYRRKMRANGRAWIRRDHAPRRAVGNFTTPADTRRTLADLQHNVAEARNSGNEKLLQVMVEAYAQARKLAGPAYT